GLKPFGPIVQGLKEVSQLSQMTDAETEWSCARRRTKVVFGAAHIDKKNTYFVALRGILGIAGLSSRARIGGGHGLPPTEAGPRVPSASGASLRWAMAAIVATFPPRRKPATFNLEQVFSKLATEAEESFPAAMRQPEVSCSGRTC